MAYIVCNQKKTRKKVHIRVCAKCKGMKCPDFRNYVQPSLFSSCAQKKRQ